MRINEKLGVPEGLNREADRIYKKMLKDLDKFLSSSSEIKLNKNNKKEVILISKYDINIGDLNLKRLPFLLNLIWYPNIESPTLISASYGFNVEYKHDDESIFMANTTNQSSLSLKIAVGDDMSKHSIVESIKKELKSKTIAHELMHMYDMNKTKISTIDSRSDYSSFKSIGGFPKLIHDFMYLLYYTTSIENKVRASELYQEMIENGVTKDNFIDFMNSTEVIMRLTEAEKFKIEDFKNKLNNDKEVIDFINGIGSSYKRIGDYADDILNILMINLLNNKFEDIKSHLTMFIKEISIKEEPLMNILLGIHSDKVVEINNKANVFLNKILNNHKKYEGNHNKYFEAIEKRLNFVGDKMKRKLYKLYDMITDDKRDSIINWDLHTKINSRSKNENILTDFKSFNKFFNTKPGI